MSQPNPSPLQARPADVKRRSLSSADDELIRAEPLKDGQNLPLLIKPSMQGLDPEAWAATHRPFIEQKVLQHGGILFRGFDIGTPQAFEQFIRGVAGETLEYRERSSPRSQVEGNIYTSTDYPADQSIFLHNENSYQHTWPRKIFFFCLTPAEQGGETPIADCRGVLRRISEETRRRFERKRCMYVRNFGHGFGLSWQTVFQTTDRAVVEAHCQRNQITPRWLDGGHLRTEAVRSAVVMHPVLKEPVWFNHVTFFHVSTLGAVGEMLLEELGEDNLPNNTYYGDGSPIEPDVLEEMRAAYRAETIAFPWGRGDVLLLDNMLTAHGRAPFKGARKVVVGMAEPINEEEVRLEGGAL